MTVPDRWLQPSPPLPVDDFEGESGLAQLAERFDLEPVPDMLRDEIAYERGDQPAQRDRFRDDSSHGLLSSRMFL